LTVYAFSTENWKRPEQEIQALMDLLKKGVQNRLPEMLKNSIRVKVLGRINEFPKDVQKAIKETEEKTKNCKNLNDCFALFEKPEIIDCDHSWECENCKEKSNPIRKTKIYYLPKYLIICLKRFDNKLRKISNEIGFSINDFIYKRSIFNCISICNHFGHILGGGHYTAYCRRNEKWFEFDDEDTNEIENPVSKNAYILIYEKKIN